jgi:hypothetical protein
MSALNSLSPAAWSTESAWCAEVCLALACAPCLLGVAVAAGHAATGAPPGCEPGAMQVAVFEQAGFRGACAVLGVGEYRMPTEMGLAAKSFDSVGISTKDRVHLEAYACGIDAFGKLDCDRLGSGWMTTAAKELEAIRGGKAPLRLTSSGSLQIEPGPDREVIECLKPGLRDCRRASSKVLRNFGTVIVRPIASGCVPAAGEAAIYASQKPVGLCTTIGIGVHSVPKDLGEVGGEVLYLKLGPSTGARLCRTTDDATTVPSCIDIDSARTIGHDRLHSIEVQARPVAPR